MLNLNGRTAVITGAAGGIGRAIATSLARRGCHLALADIDATTLASTAADIAGLPSEENVRISHHRLDVADRGAVAALPEEVVATHGGVDILVNNAGVALGGMFLEVSQDDFDWLFAINFSGVVAMTRAFLPLMQERDAAQIVNMSSLFGLIAPPGQSAYVASKFAVRGFSESLRHELAGTNVGVTVVHPGGVATAIAKNARMPASMPADEAARRRRSFDALLTMPPERAGEIIVRGIERRKPRVLVGTDAKLAALVAQLVPASYWRWITLGMKR